MTESKYQQTRRYKEHKVCIPLQKPSEHATSDPSGELGRLDDPVPEAQSGCPPGPEE